jgi:hypothetical protein
LTLILSEGILNHTGFYAVPAEPRLSCNVIDQC